MVIVSVSIGALNDYTAMVVGVLRLVLLLAVWAAHHGIDVIASEL